MLDAVRNLCNQQFSASSLEMFAIQDQSGGGGEAAMRAAAAAAKASTSCSNRHLTGERGRSRPHPSQVLKCPRCDSLNTKFCYYNNYNLSQPRHFCKSCRRYWTMGGVLRNIPVGGGCRKTSHNKKSKPRNKTASTPHRNLIPKSTSNSTATLSSSESSPLTVNNDTTSSSNSSVNISDTDRTGHVFSPELQDILKQQTGTGNLAYGNLPPEVSVPRLFSGLDHFSQPCLPTFPASRNSSENINANSLFSSLIGSSNFVGTTFSDLQCKLQQQKTAAAFFSDAGTPTCLNTVQEPSSSAKLLSGYTTNNSFFGQDSFNNNNNNNNNNNTVPLEWQVNDNSEFLFEEPYCWGAESQGNWLDQTHFSYPNQDF